MALMCDECKCTIGYEGGCDNNCPCCNDPQFVSDSELLAKALKELDKWKAYAGALEERVQVCGESYEDLEAEYFQESENN